MPENSKKIFSAFSGAFILCAAVLRLIIILFYTDAETGGEYRAGDGQGPAGGGDAPCGEERLSNSHALP